MNSRTEVLKEFQKKLLLSLGEQKSRLYLEFFRKFARGEITTSEFRKEVKSLINSEQLRTHHRFVREFGKSNATESKVYRNSMIYNDDNRRIRFYWHDDNDSIESFGVQGNAYEWLSKLQRVNQPVLEMVDKAIKVYIQRILRAVIDINSEIKMDPDTTDESSSDDHSDLSDEEEYEDESDMVSNYTVSKGLYCEFNKLLEDSEAIKEESSPSKEIKLEIKDEPMEEITLYAMKEEDDVKIEDVDVKIEEVKMEDVKVKQEQSEKKEDEQLDYVEHLVNSKEFSKVEELSKSGRRITMKHLYMTLKYKPDLIPHKSSYNTIMAKMGIEMG